MDCGIYTESPKASTARSAKSENRPLPPVPSNGEMVGQLAPATLVEC